MTFVIGANHRFKRYSDACIESLKTHKQSFKVYDLGGLGYGEKFSIEDSEFRKSGCYSTHWKPWRSRAMHVVDMMIRHLQAVNDTTVYLDADTMLMRPIPEVEAIPFDVGVTVREGHIHRINSGVIFFRPTDPAKSFCDLWRLATATTGSIQAGLNKAIKLTDAKVQEFPCSIYNCLEEPYEQAAIVHWRASMKD